MPKSESVFCFSGDILGTRKVLAVYDKTGEMMVKSAVNKFSFMTGFQTFHCIRARFTAIFEGAFEADPDMKALIGKVAEFGHSCQNEPFVWELIVSRIKDKNEDEVNRKLRKLTNNPGIVFNELDMLNLRHCVDLMLSAKDILTELESNTPMGYRLKFIFKIISGCCRREADASLTGRLQANA